MAAVTFPEPLLQRTPSPVSAPRGLLFALLGLLAALACAYQARFTYEVLTAIQDQRPSARWAFSFDVDTMAVTSVKPEAEAAGMRKGDKILTLNGQPITSTNQVYRVFENDHLGDRVDVTVMRDHPIHMVVKVAETNQNLTHAANVGLGIILGLVLPWSCLALGFYVAFVRPRDPQAWIVLGLLISFAQIVNVDTYNWPDWVRLPSEVFHYSAFFYWPLFMFLFGYYFPQQLEFTRKRPWIKYLAIIPSLIMGAIEIPIHVGLREDLSRFGSLYRFVERIDPFINVFSTAMFVLGLGLLGMKFVRAKNSDGRRRLRLLLTGLLASLLPLFALGIAAYFMKKAIDNLPPELFLPSVCALLLFPLTLAYVIVVDRAMDVRVVLRQGLQYAFARSGLVVLRLITFTLFGVAVFAIAQKLNGHVPGLILLSLTLFGAVLLVNLTMKRLGSWVDRRFFREAYNVEVVLTELSEQVRTIRETKPLIETVCEQISNSLHVTRMAVLLESNGAYVTSYSRGFDQRPAISFPKNSSVVSYLKQAILNSRDAPRVYFEDETSWIYRTPGLDDEQRSWLAYLGAELLLPLGTQDQLLGFIAAGQKRSEEPYSKADMRILSSVASQTGLALENAQLISAVAREVAIRERLAHDVEIAREVQERLFPQKLSPVAGLDYAGTCRTALGVGGDYYDFLSLPDGRAGFALGDVAGKGIPAALMMASLQASLRSEIAHGVDNLARLIGNLNKRLYEASTTNRYATFFYGQYDPATHRLDYVNAGHNPPILMRRSGSGWETRTLEAGGTVVGLLPISTYEQSTLQMQTGDYLVLFTDGVSEAMNHDDEEWGEERLEETIRACAESSLPAADTMTRILSAADTFVAGAKQYDDMTLVVMRVAA